MTSIDTSKLRTPSPADVRGKRVLVSDCKLNIKYNIMLPADLDAQLG